METLEVKIREVAKKLLSEKKIDCLIGYERGTIPLVMTPCFVSEIDAVDRLVYNPLCVHNLAKYVPEVIFAHRDSEKRLKPEERSLKKVGIVARGCTSRSIIIHLLEKQYSREEVVIIGVPCEGFVDWRKLRDFVEGKEILSGDFKKGELTVRTNEGEKVISLASLIADNCLTCPIRSPVISDIIIDNIDKKGDSPPGEMNEFEIVEEFEKLPPEERWEYFQREMSKCIRCYACRNACPSCYCRSCFAEQSMPRWIGLTVDPSDVQLFHLMRIFHMVGRCVDCGSCSAVCPMGVDLRTFLKKIDYDEWNFFRSRAGASLDKPLLLANFSEDDPDDFIFNPE